MKSKVQFLMGIGIAISFTALQSFASTFVGNGGNAGDLELQVAIQEAQESLKVVDSYKDDPKVNFCVCTENLVGHPICETLKKLTDPQVRYCAKYLRENSGELLQSLKSVSVRWSRDSIEVQENGRLRAADAVTDASQKQITVNQERFLELKDYERVFLLTHEIGHLQKENGKLIQDRQALGPYQSEDGGREFLNAIAAATVLEGLEGRVFKKHAASLSRSKSYRKHWFDLGVESVAGFETQFGVAKTTSMSFGYRYQFADALGIAAEVRSGQGSEDYFTRTKAEEKIIAGAVKLGYQFFPFSDPLTALGQSHLLLAGGMEYLSGQYKIGDGSTETSAKATSTAPVVDLSYYFPFRNGFWIFARVGYLGHKYSYETPFRDIEFKPQTLTSLGASYAF